MKASSYFSADYEQARSKFLEACAQRSLQVESILNPNAKTRSGRELFSDVVRIGAPEASKFLLLTSATHGVEGYCGSGIQVGLLREDYFDTLPTDIGVVMIHAVNPYGFAHDRRVNEDNIDLNRNYVDHVAARKRDSNYESVRPFILPDDWDGPAKQQADENIAKFIREYGAFAYQAAATGGQYRHSDGLFYGGDKLAWSWEMLRTVLTRYLGDADVVGAIDVHTGLGPYGHGELIGLGPAEQKKLARKWYGEQVTDPDVGTSTSAPITGTVGHGFADILSGVSTSFIALEYGTFEPKVVIEAVRADNWLYQKGDIESDTGRSIKLQIRDAFYGDTDEWKSDIWRRACEVVDMTITGLKTT